MGVCQALYESGLLPKIVAGSSAGSIIASFLCTRDDKSIQELLEMKGININFFGVAPLNARDPFEKMLHVAYKLYRFLSTGTI